jgi:hypothetical protein
MAYRFTTPTISEGPVGYGRLFSRFRLTRGVSVLKVDGQYYETRNPSSEEVQAAQAAYIGGYSYEVSPGERAALQAAGYTVETI